MKYIKVSFDVVNVIHIAKILTKYKNKAYIVNSRLSIGEEIKSIHKNFIIKEFDEKCFCKAYQRFIDYSINNYKGEAIKKLEIYLYETDIIVHDKLLPNDINLINSFVYKFR